MRNNLLTLSRISLLFVFATLFGFSMRTLWNMNTGILSIRLAWPSWLVILVVSAVGLLALARDLK